MKYIGSQCSACNISFKLTVLVAIVFLTLVWQFSYISSSHYRYSAHHRKPHPKSIHLQQRTHPSSSSHSSAAAKTIVDDDSERDESSNSVTATTSTDSSTSGGSTTTSDDNIVTGISEKSDTSTQKPEIILPTELSKILEKLGKKEMACKLQIDFDAEDLEETIAPYLRSKNVELHCPKHRVLTRLDDTTGRVSMQDSNDIISNDTVCQYSWVVRGRDDNANVYVGPVRFEKQQPIQLNDTFNVINISCSVRINGQETVTYRNIHLFTPTFLSNRHNHTHHLNLEEAMDMEATTSEPDGDSARAGRDFTIDYDNLESRVPTASSKLESKRDANEKARKNRKNKKKSSRKNFKRPWYEEDDYDDEKPSISGKKEIDEEAILEHIRNKEPWSNVSEEARNESVLILVIESLDRLNFIRFMPKTHSVLSTLGFILMAGMNKVEANSFPNSMALLTGLAVNDSIGESYNDYWDRPAVLRASGNDYIWNAFKRYGRVTAFMEDMVDIGLFNYFKRGFKSPPVDFYPRTYWNHMYINGYQLYPSMRNQTHYCYEKVGPKIDLFLGIIRNFVRKMNNVNPYFFYAFYSQITHEDFNNFQLLDKYIARFIMKNFAVLRKATVIVMGDHGPRYGPDVDSPLGRYKSRTPMFNIRLSDTLNHKYPHLERILKFNKYRLTNWYDVHAMLEDIAKGRYGVLMAESLDQPMSLFRTPISANRDCRSAGIPSIYCVCNNRINLNPSRGFHHLRACKEFARLLQVKLPQINCTDFGVNQTIGVAYLMPNASLDETWSRTQKVDCKILINPQQVPFRGTVIRKWSVSKNRWKHWEIVDPQHKLEDKEYIKSMKDSLCGAEMVKFTI